MKNSKILPKCINIRNGVFLVIVLVALAIIGYMRYQPIEIYRFNVGNEYDVPDGTYRQIYYVLYNTMFKPDKEVKQFIKNNNDKFVKKRYD